MGEEKSVVMRKGILCLLVGTALLPVYVAAAQPEPGAPGFYRFWIRSQLEAWERVERVEFRERSMRRLDNPFGVSTAEVISKVIGYPDGREYERELVSAEIDGRRVPARRMAEFQERWDRFGLQLGRNSNAFSGWRLRALLATRPASPPASEEYRGQSSYRVDLVPAEPLANVDRITLWFAASSGRILGSRTVFEPRGQRSSLIVELAYDRMNGIDVPVRRLIEGTVQTRRRLRHFTTIVTLETRFDEFRFSTR